MNLWPAIRLSLSLSLARQLQGLIGQQLARGSRIEREAQGQGATTRADS